MKQFTRTLVCLCLLLPIGARAETFVFGDSLSDTGNAAAFVDVQFGVSIPPTSPFVPLIGLCNPIDVLVIGQGCSDLFFLQRSVSNGPVAAQVLGDPLSVEPSFFFLPLLLRPAVFGTNYAVAGARAGGSGLGDLNAQVAGFLADLANPGLPPDAETASDSLYVVFIGGNDVRDARSALVFPLRLGPPGRIIDTPTPMISPLTGLTPETIIDNAVSVIAANIRRLIQDAAARRFLVVNAPDIGRLPETRTVAAAAEELHGIPAPLIIKGATRITRQFNNKLALRVHQIRLEQELMGDPVEITEFDLVAFLEGVRAAGSELGFVNTDDACFNSTLYLESMSVPPTREFHPDCGVDKFDTFAFFDDIHLSGKVNALVGDALANAVD